MARVKASAALRALKRQVHRKQRAKKDPTTDPRIGQTKRTPWSDKMRANPPKTRKDGSPWVPWDDQVKARIAKKEQRLATMTPEEIATDREKKCTALTSGVWGPKRPCENHAMKGMTICAQHGGNTKITQQAIKQRLLEELDPTVSALIDIRNQNRHMPSKLGAAVHILNRVLGKPGEGERTAGSGAPIINVGVAIGGLPNQPRVKIVAAVSPKRDISAEPSPEDDNDDAIEAEFDTDDNNDKDWPV